MIEQLVTRGAVGAAPRLTSSWRGLALVVAGAIVVACGSGQPATEAAGGDGLVARVVDGRGAEVVVESIDRVIPLDGDVAEIVFALGMGDRVVATDLSATYPPEADALPQIGYQRALNAEPVLAFDPTLLIGTDIAGPPETIDELERVGVPVVIVPSEPTREGVGGKIQAVADALGIAERGAELAAETDAAIDRALASRERFDRAPQVAVLYVRGSGTQLLLGRDYAIHWLVEAAGSENVADALGVDDTAPITGEAILAAAPDVLIVPAAGLESVGGVDGLLASIPALAETPAGRTGAILSYDDQLMLGNGPRTGRFLSTLIADLAEVADSSPEGAP